MKKVSSVIWGIVLIAAGALFALNASNIINFISRIKILTNCERFYKIINIKF